MINQKLHRQPVAIDRVQHRHLRLKAAPDANAAAALNAVFVATAEFGDVCREYPIVFIPAGQDEQGKTLVAPVSVFGVVPDQNLYQLPGGWRAEYVPAVLRLYPFAIAAVDASTYALCVDTASPALGNEGEALFDDAGEPTPFLKGVHQQLEAFEVEVQRTRQACTVLQDKGLLREMRFDAELPGGAKLSLDGFLTIDEERLGKLTDEELLPMARNGLLALIHAHQISLPLMRRLVQWHAQKVGAASTSAAAAPETGAASHAAPG